MSNERTRFTLRVPDKLLILLSNMAAEAGVSTNALINQILWDWLKRNKD